MCGFAGEFLFNSSRADLDLARRMCARLAHRGPDDSGDFLSSDGRCAIGFRRLAVIDPAASHQPMSLPDGKITVAFNGEIYNFRQLREELRAGGSQFRTAGDTEVLLHLYHKHGPDMLARLDGMFALAIYDGRTGQLFLARDRLGEKPLWYALLHDRIVFASEAKALLQHPMVSRDMDTASLTHYVTMGYVHAPLSAWRAVRKLLPAHYMVASAAGAGEPELYWSPQTTEMPHDAAGQVALVREAVTASVQSRLVSDVPLGAFLSGGIDSSIIVALMSKAAGRIGGVRTFTAGFDHALFDERPTARVVAKHCGAEHTELLIRPNPAEMLDRVVAMYDEPFGDSSAIPTYLICQAARQHVTVALTGDGGDEIFGGYERYRALHLADTMSPPAYLAVRLATFAASIVAPKEERSRLRRLVRFGSALSQPFAQQYLTYRSLFSPKDLRRLLTPEFARQADLDEPAQWFCDLYEDGEFPDEISRAQKHDLLTYLSDDLLVKSDIASMAASLELRSPLLNHELVPLGLSLLPAMKFSHGRGKQILRKAFADMLPAEILNRPKRGFGVPLGDWLRGELATQVKQTLLDRSFLDRGIFQPAAILGLVNDHLEGRDDHRHRLWALMVLARWLNTNDRPA